jgi:hypothetical protein
MKIHVYYRHCCDSKGSDSSNQKPRPEWFDYEDCFRNLLLTSDSDVSINIVYDRPFDDDNWIYKYIPYVNSFKRIDQRNDYKSLASTFNLVLKNKDIKDDDIVYFCENDYVHQSDWPKKVKEFFDKNPDDYLSLYDSLDFYSLKENSSKKWEIIQTNSSHWREVKTFTNSFCIKKRIVNEDFHVHTTDFSDYSKFLSLGENQNRKLYVPIPSLSTHCVKENLAPVIDWEKTVSYLNKDKKDIRIGVIVCGQWRPAGFECSDYIKNLLKDYQTDYFVSLWDSWYGKSFRIDTTNTVVTREQIQDLKDHHETPLTPLQIDTIKKIYNPIYFQICNAEEFQKIKEIENHPKEISSWPQFYLQYKANKFIKEYEREKQIKYDIIFKIRPEIIFPKSQEENVHNSIKIVLNSSKRFYTYHEARIDQIKETPQKNFCWDFYSICSRDSEDFFSEWVERSLNNEKVYHGEMVLEKEFIPNQPLIKDNPLPVIIRELFRYENLYEFFYNDNQKKFLIPETNSRYTLIELIDSVLYKHKQDGDIEWEYLNKIFLSEKDCLIEIEPNLIKVGNCNVNGNRCTFCQKRIGKRLENNFKLLNDDELNRYDIPHQGTFFEVKESTQRRLAKEIKELYNRLDLMI